MSQSLDPDGVHLTPVSGLHYLLHLYDSTLSIISQFGSDADSRVVVVQEAVRQHDDRLAYLENRHGALAARCDIKFAIDAEFNDWVSNRSQEDWITILGLPRINAANDREWQLAVKRQVNEAIKLVLKISRSNVEYSILYVVNPIKHRPHGLTVVNVRMDSVESSDRIRTIYSGFFRRNDRLKLPASLKGVSFRNKVTLDTRIRISIMQQLAANYKSTNPDAEVKVRGYDSRPSVLIVPGRSSAAATSAAVPSRPRVFSFIDAVQTMSPALSDENLSKIFQVVGGHHPGELRRYFVILSDDDRDRCQRLVRPRGAVSSTATSAGRTSGPSTGMELEAGFLASLRAPPPPPPPPAPERRSVRSRSRTPRASRSISPAKRGLKRNHQSEDRSMRRKRTRRSPSGSSSDSSVARSYPKSSKKCTRSPSGSESDSSESKSVRKAKSTKSKKSTRSRRRTSSSSDATRHNGTKKSAKPRKH